MVTVEWRCSNTLDVDHVTVGVVVCLPYQHVYHTTRVIYRRLCPLCLGKIPIRRHLSFTTRCANCKRKTFLQTSRETVLRYREGQGEYRRKILHTDLDKNVQSNLGTGRVATHGGTSILSRRASKTSPSAIRWKIQWRKSGTTPRTTHFFHVGLRNPGDQIPHTGMGAIKGETT